MASLEEILAAQLLRKKEELATKNPFSIAGQAVNELDLKGAFDPEDAWKAQLIQNLVGGFANNVGQRQVENEFSSIASRLSRAYEQPDVVEAMRQQTDLGEFSGLAKMIQDQRRAQIDEYMGREAAAFPYDIAKIREQNKAYMMRPQYQPIGEATTEVLQELDPRFAGITDKSEASLALRAKEMAGVQERFKAAPLPTSTQAKIEAGLEIDQKMKPLIDIAERLDKDPSSKYVQVTKDSFLSMIPANERRNLQEWLDFGGFEVAVAAQGRNTSDRDAKIVLDFLSGQGAAATPGELVKRLKYFRDRSKYMAKTALDVAEKQPRFADTAKEMRKLFEDDTSGAFNSMTEETRSTRGEYMGKDPATGLDIYRKAR